MSATVPQIHFYSEGNFLAPTGQAHEHLRRLKARLADAGFDLVSVIKLTRLDASLAESIRDAAVRAGLPAGVGALKVVLVGNSGGRFWDSLTQAERDAADPLDEFSAARAGDAIASLFGQAPSVPVYPGECDFSLLALGRACGWGSPSWLGVYIHPEFGTWFAFRAVLVTTAALPDDVLGESTDACLQCVTRDCVAACPVGAPHPPGRFDLESCVSQRLADGSPCANRCGAREACPVGAGYRYPRELVSHVYGRSLESLKRYAADRGSGTA